MRSNATYVSFIIVGSAVTGWAYNSFMDYVWATVNRGKLYGDIDWSKWNSIYKEE